MSVKKDKNAKKNTIQEAPKLRKNFFQLMLLTVSGAAIFTLPYFRLSYYDVYAEMFGLTHVQMGVLGSAYGLLGLFSYMLGGALADMVSARKLVTFSLIFTGLGGVVHLFTESFTVLVGIYAIWGITSLLTFWPALIKAIRMLANPEEQGRAFGIFEGVRGIVNAILFPGVLAMFTFVASRAGEFAGIRGIIIFYSSLVIVNGILIYFTVPDTTKDADREKFSPKILLEVIKMPQVWLACFILFMSYTYIMSFWYFNPYTSEVLGGSIAIAAIVTIIPQYCRPFGSIGGAWLGVRVGNPMVRLITLSVLGIMTVVILFIPTVPNSIPIFIGVATVIYLMMYANYGLVFPMLEEGRVPIHATGIAIGLISTLGYAPEVLVPVIAGTILDRNPGAAGYHQYFMIMAVTCFLAVAGVLIWMKLYGNKNVPEAVVEEGGAEEKVNSLE